MCYFTSDPPLVELSPCSKGGQGEGEAAVISHQPVSQVIESYKVSNLAASVFRSALVS